jgi:uncharacterized protein YbdZ (MbtH family)
MNYIPFLVIIMIAPVIASPMPQQIIINNATNECAIFWRGDECSSCELPEGWEILDNSWEYPEACPEGYTTVELNFVCTPFKAKFCCSQGHSGSYGDCEDMVINDAMKQCAFVDDINNCTLPEGWAAYEGGDGFQDGLCPYEYEWTDIECLNGTSLVENTSNVVENTTDQVLGDVPVNRNPDNTPYAVFILVVVAAFAAFIALKKK